MKENNQEMEIREADPRVYEDCRNQGHMLATWKTENICHTCAAASICHAYISMSSMGDSLIAVNRCLSHIDPSKTKR